MIHNVRMAEYNPEYEYDLSEEMFNAALQRLKIKHAQKYSFILKRGKTLRNALLS